VYRRIIVEFKSKYAKLKRKKEAEIFKFDERIFIENLESKK